MGESVFGEGFSAHFRGLGRTRGHRRLPAVEPLTAIADHTPAQRRQAEQLKSDGEPPEPLLPLDD